VSGHAHDRAPAAAIARWAALVPAGGAVLDVAAGSGRHARLFAQRGHRVLALDRDVAALRELAASVPGIDVLQADLEGAPWPLVGRTFGAVVVVDYLWRPLLPALVASVAPGGVLLYETFMVGHERLGRPRNPDFLLRPGELPDAVRGALEVLEHEEGPEGEPRVAVRQRLCARRPRAR
jgi:SAM-dependent methyltransferase